MWFLIGVVITAFGIAFITKAALGTTPITSLPYVMSFRFAPSIGVFTFILNFLFIVLQAVLLRREFALIQWLQLLVNVVFSAAIDISMWALGWMNPQDLWLQLIVIVIGCAILAFGIAVQVAPGVLAVPGEGAVRAIAIVSRIRFGTIKVAFDWTLIAIATICSFAFFQELRGVGLGTILSAFLVGVFVNVYFTRLTWLGKLNPPPLALDD
nr:DUF6198 family protein [Flaviflexus huanghaiensis]